MSQIDETKMEKLLDNTLRGKRTLLWLKIFLVFMIVIMLLGYSVWNMANGQMVQNPDAPMAMSMLLLVLGIAFVGFALSITIIIMAVHWFCWLFRSTQNMKKLQPDAMSPWAATILCLIPFVGQIVHYFVFKSLIKRTQAELDSRNGDCPTVPMNFLNIWIGLTIVSTIMGSIEEMKIVVGTGAVLGVAALVLYIKVFTAYIAQEECLFKLHEEQVLRQKVDQVLREREIEKAASQVQAATYESEKPSAEKSEGPVTYADDAPPPPPEK